MLSILADILYLLFPLACILAVPRGEGVGGRSGRLILGIALYQFLLLAFGLILGHAGHLTAPIFAVAIGGATLLLAVLGAPNGIEPLPARLHRYWRTWRGAATLLAIVTLAAAFALELGFDFLYGTRHGDGLWYHIPRVMFWAGQGNFDPWPTPVAASIGLPVGADLILLHKILLGRGWSGSGYVTLFLVIGSAASVYVGGRLLRLRRWQAGMAALLFASFPAVGLRVWSVNSDIAAAFPMLAAFVVLHRVDRPRFALALFILLVGVAIACKPTVAPPALVLACAALWRCRDKIVPLRKDVLPYAATFLSAAIVLASYWPVYAAFADFLGGDYGKVHRSATVAQFLHGLAMHTGYWVLEPLGYLTRFNEAWELDAVAAFYRALGANFASLPEIWKPYPGQDSGYTALASVLALPVLVTGLSPRARRSVVILLLLVYIPLTGLIQPQPYFVRYNVLLLAGIALVWGGTRVLAKGRRRWLLPTVLLLNVTALLGVAAINVCLHRGRWSQPGGLYYYISETDREMLATSLHGRPLLVMTESSERLASLDALLPGPEIAFPLQYVICPADGDWDRALRTAPSPWLALVHQGGETIIPGPVFQRPGGHTCNETPLPYLESALERAGWTRHRRGPLVDLWRSLLPARK